MFPTEIKATYKQGIRADLMDNLNNNLPTLITIALPPMDFGHVVVVIGYDPVTNELQFFDPAYNEKFSELKFNDNYGKKLGVSTFEALWGRSNLFIRNNSMVTVEKYPMKTVPIIRLGYGNRTIINIR